MALAHQKMGATRYNQENRFVNTPSTEDIAMKKLFSSWWINRFHNFRWAKQMRRDHLPTIFCLYRLRAIVLNRFSSRDPIRSMIEQLARPVLDSHLWSIFSSTFLRPSIWPLPVTSRSGPRLTRYGGFNVWSLAVWIDAIADRFIFISTPLGARPLVVRPRDLDLCIFKLTLCCTRKRLSNKLSQIYLPPPLFIIKNI